MTYRFAVLGIAMVGSLVGQSLPRPPSVSIVDLNPAPGCFNEPSIAINPRQPNQVAAAYQVDATVTVSDDAGRHWGRAIPALREYKRSGDVSITYDARGHAILCFIAFDKLGTPEYWAHNATRNGIFVRRSLDGGRTWEARSVPVLANGNLPGNVFEDKPYIVADSSGGRFNGNLYIGWTHFTLDQSVMYFSRSTDGGATWTKPLTLSEHPGLPRDDNGCLEGFSGTVGADGVVHVVWSDGSHIYYTSSRDGGRRFARPRAVMHTAPSYFNVNKVSRSNGFPQIAAGPVSGSSALASHPLYLAWSDYRNGDVDVFCSTSYDNGRTWGHPVRVNTDALHDGSDQFFQWLTVDAHDGAMYLLFYDRRDDPANGNATLTLARSTDHGHSFRNYQWNEKPFDPEGAFLGDYTGLAAYNGRVYGIWAEQRSRSSKAGHRTVVRVGMADFAGSAQSGSAQPGSAK